MRHSLDFRQALAGATQRVVAWPPPDSHPLYAEVATPNNRSGRTAADLRLAIRLAAVTTLIAAGIGLGHGVTASSDPLGGSASSIPAADVHPLAAADAIEATLRAR